MHAIVLDDTLTCCLLLCKCWCTPHIWLGALWSGEPSGYASYSCILIFCGLSVDVCTWHTNKLKCFCDTVNVVIVTGCIEMEVQKKVLCFVPSAFWLAAEDMKDMGDVLNKTLCINFISLIYKMYLTE